MKTNKRKTKGPHVRLNFPATLLAGKSAGELAQNQHILLRASWTYLLDRTSFQSGKLASSRLQSIAPMAA